MSTPQRILSVDIFRALTMFFMLWVNDFPTLTGVPKWLVHAAQGEHYIGFSDIIFPMFLFVMGLSIPLAIQNKLSKKISLMSNVKHILLRSASLLIIGVYMVNYETAHTGSMLIGRYPWCFFMALGVVLIWIDWKKSPVYKELHLPLQGIGIVILIFLAIIYRGGKDGELWMTTQWWGILGLIGWAYLSNSLIFLFSKGNLWVCIGAFVLFNVLAVLNYAGYLSNLPFGLKYLGTVIHGYIPAFASAGVVTTLVLQRLKQKKHNYRLLFIVLFGVALVVYAFIMEPHYWMIYKLNISIGVSLLAFAVVYFVVEIKGISNWAKVISAAGTATLTCYMIPYFVYSLREISGLRFPDFINYGVVGLIVSLIYAYLVIYLTSILERKKIKLKL